MPLQLDPKKRPYLIDSQRLEFTADVIHCRELEPGRFAVSLRATYFYPTSGGQPHDQGWLGDVAVADVQEDSKGEVVHITEGVVALGSIHARINAARRTDHMQQHSGQHLLSALCEQLYERDTLSFHLGRDRCSIDLTGQELSQEELKKLEQTANQVIKEARRVTARIASPTELTQLRSSAPAGLDQVRVIEIAGWDLNACCGTHVSTTSANGFTKLMWQERIRNQTRLYFSCGNRALEEFATVLGQRDELQKILTCGPEDLRVRVSDLMLEVKSQRKRIRSLQEQGAVERAKLWNQSAMIYGNTPVVLQVIEGDFEYLRFLATAINDLGALALLGARSTRAYLMFSCPQAHEHDLREAMRLAVHEIHGKGGGPGPHVQGSGAEGAGLESALEVARAWVENHLRNLN